MFGHRGFSRTGITAFVAVCAIVLVAIWQTWSLVSSKTAQLTASATQNGGAPNTLASEDWMADLNGIGVHQPNATSSTPEEVSHLGKDIVAQLMMNADALKKAGVFSTDTAASMIDDLASSVNPTLAHRVWTAADIAVATDTSYARVMRYRADLQRAFRPLTKVKNAELALYAQYIDTKNPKFLASLQAAIGNYRDAITQTSRVNTPADALSYHLAILNSMELFAATIDAMSRNTADPLTSLTLLRSYNSADTGMYNSFNDLYAYFRSKKQ